MKDRERENAWEAAWYNGKSAASRLGNPSSNPGKAKHPLIEIVAYMVTYKCVKEQAGLEAANSHPIIRDNEQA